MALSIDRREAYVFPALYPILDPELTSVPLPSLAASLADAGVGLMQLRDKRSPAGPMHARAKELAAWLATRGVIFIVNDRPDVAALSGAAGVHLGQQDLGVEDARAICRPPLWVGVSTHTLRQVREADRSSSDYIAVGPIFATHTKQDPDPVVGLRFLRTARTLTRKPLVAIGGITLGSAADVYRAGADSVSVIGDLLAADDPGARARQYLAIAEQVLIERG
jgi:thiamine-phosphate pyrophosphorylase